MITRIMIVYAYIVIPADQSEETAALVDLVESGASLLNTIDSLLKDIYTLSEIAAKSMYPKMVYTCYTENN